MTENEQTGTDQRWRDKYLDALDEQEQQEKRFVEQRSLLQRAMVRVSVAAGGQSSELDQALENLRQHLRKNEASDLTPALGQLDQALIQFESNRESSNKQLRQGFEGLLDTLGRQDISAEQKKALRTLSQDINRQRELLQACPQLLHKLAALQRHILLQEPAPATTASGGLLARLLGKKELSTAVPEPVGDGQEHKADRALFELNPNATLRDSQTVSLQLCSIINELLTSVESQAVAPTALKQLQQRLQGGLQNVDLIPVLEQVRDLVMAAYIAATRTYAEYLNRVNEELSAIYEGLGGVAAQSQVLQGASEQLNSHMLNEISALESEVSQARDLKTLQSQVQAKLGGIRAVLDNFRQVGESNEPVAGRLSALAEKIQIMEQEARENKAVLELQRHKALHDPLTGMPNREAFNERVAYELLRCKRYANPLTLAVCDLDYFKKINDSLGHQAGDRVLKVLSKAIARRLREVDFFGRYGGEEFVILLPETTAEQALSALDKIRAAIAKTGFSYKEQPLEVTVSIGIAEFSSEDTAESLFERADRALYAAKAAGRNQCGIDQGQSRS
ncbi:MAG TPA: diguanylate cyclase [Cellvibrionaceae bacterium]